MIGLKIKNYFDNLTLKKMIWLAPIVYLFHIIEEAAFGFYMFTNKHFGGDFTLERFLISNLFIMIGYLLLIGIFTIYPNRVARFIVLAGLLAAQFFNAFFHLILTIYYGEYCPGLITGILLYIPYVTLVMRTAYREKHINITTGIILYITGAILMTLFAIVIFYLS